MDESDEGIAVLESSELLSHLGSSSNEGGVRQSRSYPTACAGPKGEDR